METNVLLMISFLVICLSLLLAYIDIYDLPEFGTKERVDLAVCILSARNNFNFRSAIRRSWLTDAQAENKGKSVIAKFVVGNVDCPIHPKDRISPHDCQKWSPVVPENPSQLTAFSLISSEDNTKCQIVHSLYVKVMHDVLLKALGIAEIFPLDTLSAGESVQVVLYDAVTDDEITAVHFVQKEGVTFGGFIYKPVQELHLPKGYEFTVQAVLPAEKWRKRTLSYSAGGQMLQDMQSCETKQAHHQMLYVQLLDDDQTVLAPSQNTSFIAAASFTFSVLDIISLERHIASETQRDLAWQEEVRAVVAQLQDEALHHGDLITVDVVDVYRNLPHKLLLCYTWLQVRYAADFVLKTDDDCFVNVDAVLESLPDQHPGLRLWWGNFRQNWAVDRHGKWRESHFSSSVYPRFACGSGYVVSGNIHSWLVQNAHVLRKFQGEDVSLGIWLSGHDVTYLQDDRWQCGMSCQDDVLSLPELNAEMVWWYWNNSRYCPSPCRAC